MLKAELKVFPICYELRFSVNKNRLLCLATANVYSFGCHVPIVILSDRSLLGALFEVLTSCCSGGPPISTLAYYFYPFYSKDLFPVGSTGGKFTDPNSLLFL